MSAQDAGASSHLQLCNHLLRCIAFILHSLQGLLQPASCCRPPLPQCGMHRLPLLHCGGRPDLSLLQLMLQLLLMLRLLTLQVAQLRLGLCSLLSIHSSLQQGSSVCRAPTSNVACMHQGRVRRPC